MKKTFTLLLGAVFLATGFAQAQTSKIADNETNGVDWTPLFKSWENQCQGNHALDKMFDSMSPTLPQHAYDYSLEQLRNGQFRVDHIIAPTKYQTAIFNKPTLKFDGDNGIYSVVSIPVSGYYYGMPMVQIENIAGIGNGIRSQSITVDMPLDKVKNILSRKANIRYETVYDAPVVEDPDSSYEQMGMNFIKNTDDPSQTIIYCDFSS